MRLIYGRQCSTEFLDTLRATLDEWGDYTRSKTYINVMNNQLPERLYGSLLMQSYIERRCDGQAFVYDASVKIGRQSFPNRAAKISKVIKSRGYVCSQKILSE